MDLLEAKRRIRAEARARRDSIAPEVRAHASDEIVRRVTGLPAFQAARRVALYAEVGSEVETSAFELAAREAGKEVLFPRVEVTELVFAPGERASLVPGAFGIPAPAAPAVEPASIELFLVPGLAFDGGHHRLGYGKGYYDRALLRAPKATTVGLAFELQVVPALPIGPHDVALSLVVTEARIL